MKNQKRKTGINITPGQVRYLKTMARQVFGNDDAAYREMLWGVARVKSCKDLKGPKVDLVIGHLEKCVGKRAPEYGDRRLHSRAPKPQAGKPVPQKITARQLYEIRERWRQVSRAADKDKALRSFLEKRFRVAAPEWLTLGQASRVIEALKAMGRRMAGSTGRMPVPPDARPTGIDGG